MKRTIALIVVPPIVVTIVAIVVLLALVPGLPATIATHWGASGVDGRGTVGDLIVPMLVIVPVMIVLLVVFVVLSSRRGSSTLLERSTIVISVFAGSVVALTSLAVAVPQRDGARDFSPVPWVIGAFAIAVVLAIGCALLSRPVPVANRVATGGPTLDLSGTERAVWSRTVTASVWVQLIVLAAGVVVLVVVWIAGAAWIALPEAVLFAFVIATLHWRVIVSSSGILVRSGLGFPRFRVPIAEVAEARSIPVNPLAQFGGWGVRVGGTGWGVIVRGGDAIEVQREGRSSFFVTVDDAETGAALLNTFAVARNPRS